MRPILAAALLCLPISLVSAQDEYLTGEALQAVVERDCKEGCITFNREEAAKLEEDLQTLLARKQKEAFEQGVQYQKSACPSLI
jgi:hypothetical protein